MSDDDPKKPPENRPPGAPKQSGRVAYDAKGNPVWEWETSTGVFDRNVTTQRLKKLEAKLTLEDTQSVAKQKTLAVQEAERMPGGGMNPYDTGGASTTDSGSATHPALVHKQAKGRTVVSNSLASKYAAVAKKNERAVPKSIWQKLLSIFTGKK